MRAQISALPTERLVARGLEGTIRIAFEEPPPSGAEIVARSHPLPATLAEVLLEGALDPSSGPVASLGRAAVPSGSALARIGAAIGAGMLA